MSLRLIAAPTSEPVTLAEAKLHLRVSVTDDDALITTLIQAAREDCEQRIERSLMPQTWEVQIDCFPSVITLPRPPITSVTSLKYLDSTGAQQTLDPSAYKADIADEPGRIVPAYGTGWPAIQGGQPGAVVVRYVAGYADAASVPAALKSWIKLRLGTFYEYREEIVAGQRAQDIPFGDGLLDRFKVWSI